MENRPRRNTATYVNVNVYKPPEDSVKIYVLVGKDLVPEGTKSDLQCEAIFDGKTHSTKSVKDDNAPYWDEGLRIGTHQMKGDLRLQVRDKLSDKVTGWADLKLEDIPPMFDDWVRLHDEKGTFAGEIRLTIANEIGFT